VIVKKLKANELQHHGVKGQKWGVRNGPPYPIEDTVLKKGTKLNTVAMAKKDNMESMVSLGNPEVYRQIKGLKKQWMYTYNNDYDQDVYKGPFAAYLIQSRGAQYLDEHKYEVVKDLKMPTKKQRIDEFAEVYKNNKNIVKKDLENIKQVLIKYNVGNDSEKKMYRNFNVKKFNINDDEQLNCAYNMFNHMMENISTSKTAQLYKQQIEKKFDAMVDDNNQGVYNDAKDPIIVFRAEEVLRTIGTMPINSKDVNESLEKVRKKMEDQGKRVKL